MPHQKKIMLLGGLRYLVPVIEAAHKQGYYVITADYLPNNIAHRYSDEYVNVSITDKEAVLKEAQKRDIDGIISFAVDPGVVTAAYVQRQMNLPSMGPYESVVILQNKDKFRQFLRENNFNVPKSKGYSSINDAMLDADIWQYPIIVKPTDSAGSKGVSRVDRKDELEKALIEAKSKSISGRIIVEDFMEKRGCSSDSDSFLYKGNLVFVSYNAQYFDSGAANPYTPAAFTYPSTFTNREEQYLTSELQRLMSLLKMQTSVFNIETRIGIDGKPYIMECSPRGGGNRLCEMLRYVANIDLITAQVRAAVGDSIDDIGECKYSGHWAEIILHADREGVYKGIEIDSKYQCNIVEQDIWKREGDVVKSFNGANDTIGTLIMHFDTAEQMQRALQTQTKWIKIKTIKKVNDMIENVILKSVNLWGGGISLYSPCYEYQAA